MTSAHREGGTREKASFLTQVDVTGEEAMGLLAVDVGVVRVGGLEGSRGVGQEVVEERPLLGVSKILCPCNLGKFRTTRVGT